MYDFGWRQYMPDLGRWYGMDQLSEMYHDNSPYNFVGNIPVNFINPDGRCINRPEGEPCPESPGGSQNPAPIEEVWVGTKPKKSTTSSSTSLGYNFGASFLSYALDTSFSTGGTRGGSGGSGGGGMPVDPWVQYRKDLADYRLAQSRRTLYNKIDEYWKSQAVSITVGGELRGVFFNANLSLTLAFNLSDATPQLFGSLGGRLGFEYEVSGISAGVQLGEHQTYGNVDGKKYTDVFGGMEGESTGYSGSAFLGGEQNRSSIDGEIITDYGVKNTYINLGTGYGFGKTTSSTINIHKLLKRNIYRSPQFY